MAWHRCPQSPAAGGANANGFSAWPCRNQTRSFEVPCEAESRSARAVRSPIRPRIKTTNSTFQFRLRNISEAIRSWPTGACPWLACRSQLPLHKRSGWIGAMYLHSLILLLRNTRTIPSSQCNISRYWFVFGHLVPLPAVSGCLECICEPRVPSRLRLKLGLWARGGRIFKSEIMGKENRTSFHQASLALEDVHELDHTAKLVGPTNAEASAAAGPALQLCS
ncbi:hypothetical protein LX36DRAFT_317988 [Colletotrichum falcatum]|nr:hypothetical protein LX36DRAFT_317988 [Colletotrichum falcatum]